MIDARGKFAQVRVNTVPEVQPHLPAVHPDNLGHAVFQNLVQRGKERVNMNAVSFRIGEGRSLNAHAQPGRTYVEQKSRNTGAFFT